MYIQALKQRQFYIDTFAWHRFHMLDYYKVLACVVLFWFEPVEPVVCSKCGGRAYTRPGRLDGVTIYSVVCTGCGSMMHGADSRCKQYSTTKRQAIKRWNKMNLGTVCEIRKD